MTHASEIDTETTFQMQHEETITPSSRVTLGLLWAILGALALIMLFFWNRFDGLDDRFVTQKLFDERTTAIEKRIDERTATLQKQIERLEAALDRQARR